jgi:hypothetical protein
MTNPYQSSSHPADLAPAKPYTRFWFILDLFWLGSAAGPAIVELIEVVCYWLLNEKLDVDTLAVNSIGLLLAIAFSLLLVLLLFGISFIVNIVGSIKGRRMSIAGVITNIVSLACIIIPGP